MMEKPEKTINRGLRFAIILASAVTACAPTLVRADLVIGTLGGAGTTITFDTTLTGVNNGAYTGGGFAPSPSGGKLDSNSWAITGNGSDGPSSNGTLNFGETDTNGDFARGSGGENVSNPGLYSFDRDNSGTNNRSFGIQATDANFSPGTVTLKIKNTTGSTAGWNISYDLYTYNNTNNSSSIKFSFSNDATSFTALTALDTLSPTTADGVVGANTDWSAATHREAVTNLLTANNGNFYIRWTIDDAGAASGERDQLAIDNINVIAFVPEASSFLFGCVIFGAVGLSVAGRRLVPHFFRQ
jgi:hypothetical protein